LLNENNTKGGSDMKKGLKLKSNNPTIGIVTISAPEAAWNPEIYQRGKEQLEKRGVQVIEGETVHSEYFYLAERPEKIAEGLHNMFLRDDIEAIMCAGGGTCMNKVLTFLDFSLIRDNYKPFIGISNIVSLMVPLLNEGIVSFHGPFSIWSYGLPDTTPTDFTHRNWIEVLSGYTGRLPSVTKWKTFRSGVAEGQLIGGNIWSLGVIAGTRFCPASLFDGKILIIEDIGKTYDRLDGILTQMKLLGMFEKLSGVIIGKLQGCNPPENAKMGVEDFISLVFGEYDFPVIYNCDFGHIPDNLCLPLGCMVKLEAKDEPEVTLLEPGVV